MGDVLTFIGRSAEAIDHYRKAMKLNPKHQAYYLYRLGRSQFFAEQFEEATKTLETYHRRNPYGSRMWVLAAAYATTGRPEVAGDLLDVRNTGTEQEYYNYYYGSEIRDKAIILYTLALLKNEELAYPVLKEICDNFNNDTWYNTQAVSWGLFSYMKWTELLPGDKMTPSKVKITLNGVKSDQTILAKQIWSKDLNINAGNNSFTIENNSEKPLYITVARKGIPLVSDQVREDKGLIMKIDYVNMDLNPVDRKNLEQGSDFMMVVKVTNTSFNKVDNIALTQMVPSGWEIQNTRLFEAKYAIKESTYDYRDFRDDRVNTYFALEKGETKTFLLILNAAYRGEFYQPSVWCEAMYIANCYSRHPGNPVKVTGQKIE